MARYIDADKLEGELFRDGIAGIFLDYPRRRKYTIGEIRGMLKNERIAPTADVVPKSEVEALKVLLEMNDRAYESLRELYDIDTTALIEARKKTETEVAREIFAEIEKYVEVALMNGHIETPILCIGYSTFAELKKKYTDIAEKQGG